MSDKIIRQGYNTFDVAFGETENLEDSCTLPCIILCGPCDKENISVTGDIANIPGINPANSPILDASGATPTLGQGINPFNVIEESIKVYFSWRFKDDIARNVFFILEFSKTKKFRGESYCAYQIDSVTPPGAYNILKKCYYHPIPASKFGANEQWYWRVSAFQRTADGVIRTSEKSDVRSFKLSGIGTGNLGLITGNAGGLSQLRANEIAKSVISQQYCEDADVGGKIAGPDILKLDECGRFYLDIWYKCTIQPGEDNDASRLKLVGIQGIKWEICGTISKGDENNLEPINVGSDYNAVFDSPLPSGNLGPSFTPAPYCDEQNSEALAPHTVTPGTTDYAPSNLGPILCLEADEGAKQFCLTPLRMPEFCYYRVDANGNKVSTNWNSVATIKVTVTFRRWLTPAEASFDINQSNFPSTPYVLFSCCIYKDVIIEADPKFSDTIGSDLVWLELCDDVGPAEYKEMSDEIKCSMWWGTKSDLCGRNLSSVDPDVPLPVYDANNPHPMLDEDLIPEAFRVTPQWRDDKEDPCTPATNGKCFETQSDPDKKIKVLNPYWGHFWKGDCVKARRWHTKEDCYEIVTEPCNVILARVEGVSKNGPNACPDDSNWLIASANPGPDPIPPGGRGWVSIKVRGGGELRHLQVLNGGTVNGEIGSAVYIRLNKASCRYEILPGEVDIDLCPALKGLPEVKVPETIIDSVRFVITSAIGLNGDGDMCGSTSWCDFVECTLPLADKAEISGVTCRYNFGRPASDGSDFSVGAITGASLTDFIANLTAAGYTASVTANGLAISGPNSPGSITVTFNTVNGPETFSLTCTPNGSPPNVVTDDCRKWDFCDLLICGTDGSGIDPTAEFVAIFPGSNNDCTRATFCEMICGALPPNVNPGGGNPEIIVKYGNECTLQTFCEVICGVFTESSGGDGCSFDFLLAKNGSDCVSIPAIEQMILPKPGGVEVVVSVSCDDETGELVVLKETIWAWSEDPTPDCVTVKVPTCPL